MKTLIAVLALFAGTAAHASPRTLVFMTDFGVKDSAVAVCKGVMWAIDPDLRIVDLTHEVPVFDIQAAGRLLEQTVPFYPERTVFVAVVDPGVGSPRKAVAVKTKKRHYLVGPDNGMFAAVIEKEGLEGAVELKEARFFRTPDASSTFHGRDIFSPVGAHLAAGVKLETLGPKLASLTPLPRAKAVLRDGVLFGEVSYIEDPYGNIVTDIPGDLVEKAGLKPGMKLHVAIGELALTMPFEKTFSDVPEGADLALTHSRGPLSFSINMGDFAKAHGIKAHQAVSVRRAP